MASAAVATVLSMVRGPSRVVVDFDDTLQAIAQVASSTAPDGSGTHTSRPRNTRTATLPLQVALEAAVTRRG
jgi:hypothetical protein